MRALGDEAEAAAKAAEALAAPTPAASRDAIEILEKASRGESWRL
jgi:hypothetical protein